MVGGVLVRMIFPLPSRLEGHSFRQGPGQGAGDASSVDFVPATDSSRCAARTRDLSGDEDGLGRQEGKIPPGARYKIAPSSLREPVLFALFNFFLDLCLFRTRPQDLPASPVLLAFLAGIAVLLNLALIGGHASGPLAALGEAVTEVAVMLGVLYLALERMGHPGRFVQTASALLGSGIVLGTFALPLSGLDPGDAVLAQVAILAWSILVMGHILRHAFDTGLAAASLIALGYTLFSYSLLAILFPPVA